MISLSSNMLVKMLFHDRLRLCYWELRKMLFIRFKLRARPNLICELLNLRMRSGKQYDSNNTYLFGIY